jgi:hypothetical protein
MTFIERTFMFDTTQLLIDHFVQKIREGYCRTYGGWNSHFADIIGWAGAMALENIANSDALYHNVEHTILVTLVGQEILRGKHIREGGIPVKTGCTASSPCSAMTSAMSKESADKTEFSEGLYATGIDGEMVKVPQGLVMRP